MMHFRGCTLSLFTEKRSFTSVLLLPENFFPVFLKYCSSLFPLTVATAPSYAAYPLLRNAPTYISQPSCASMRRCWMNARRVLQSKTPTLSGAQLTLILLKIYSRCEINEASLPDAFPRRGSVDSVNNTAASGGGVSH